MKPEVVVKTSIQATDLQPSRDRMSVEVQKLINSVEQMKKISEQKQLTLAGVDTATTGTKVLATIQEAGKIIQLLNSIEAQIHKANEVASNKNMYNIDNNPQHTK